MHRSRCHRKTVKLSGPVAWYTGPEMQDKTWNVVGHSKDLKEKARTSE